MSENLSQKHHIIHFSGFHLRHSTSGYKKYPADPKSSDILVFEPGKCG